MTGFGAYLISLLSLIVDYNLFRLFMAIVLVFGVFALVRGLTRRRRERDGSPE